MYSTLLFPYISEYALTNRSRRIYKTDKKTGCIYYEACRFKTNEDPRFANREVISLEIDTNLSPNFTVEDINFQTGRSVLCHLTNFEQPRHGATKLTMSVFYIDEEQEQHETTHSFYMPTLPGTVASKLARALSYFQKEAQAQIAKVNSRGFDYGHQRRGEYYASYVVIRARELDSKRRNREDRFLSDIWGLDILGLNLILLIYSIRNGNKLHKPGSITTLISGLVSPQITKWTPRKFLYTQEDMDRLDLAMEFYRLNREKLGKHASECGSDFKFNEAKFREILNLGASK